MLCSCTKWVGSGRVCSGRFGSGQVDRVSRVGSVRWVGSGGSGQVNLVWSVGSGQLGRVCQVGRV